MTLADEHPLTTILRKALLAAHAEASAATAPDQYRRDQNQSYAEKRWAEVDALIRAFMASDHNDATPGGQH